VEQAVVEGVAVRAEVVRRAVAEFLAVIGRHRDERGSRSKSFI
jgi:hypothetical protein